jgi:cardiolipin synthase
MTIPNLLTLVRIFLTPLLAWLLANRWMTAAFYIFFIAGLTDALDGSIARILGQKSRLGSYIDPLADKLLLITCFLLLWKVGQIPSWLLLITVGRDILILCGFFVLLICQVKVEIRPLVSSKLTTLFELGTVFALLGKSIPALSGWLHEWMYPVLFFTTAGFSVLSAVLYFSVGVSLLQNKWRTGGENPGSKGGERSKDHRPGARGKACCD